MKIQILSVATAVVALALITGCAESGKRMGAAAENDQNVLTGGPMVGTKINDLPPAVQRTLQERVGSAEIAGIDKEKEDGRVYYKVSFIQPGKNPKMIIAEDGTVVTSTHNH